MKKTSYPCLFLLLLIVVVMASSCSIVCPEAGMNLDDRSIEVIPSPIHSPDNLPQILNEIETNIVSVRPPNRSPRSRLVYLNFTGPFNNYVPEPYDGYTLCQSNDVCTIWIRSDTHNMKALIAHELGHAIGLRHTQDTSSVMTCSPTNPYFIEGDFRLNF